MDAPKKIDMLDAVRLTREGRLDEAMAALRRSLSPSARSDEAASYQLPPLPPLRGGAGLPGLLLPGLLGGLVQRVARFRSAHRFEESREEGFTQDSGEKAEDRVHERVEESGRPAHDVTIDLVVERVAPRIDESLVERIDLTLEQALQPTPLERVQPPAALRGDRHEKTPNRPHAWKREDVKSARISAPAVARGPAPSPEQRRFVQRSFANAAGSRAYKLYVPSGHASEPLPLLVMLHGCTQSPDDFAAGTRMNRIAEEQKFLVAYPAQPVSANMGKCWNWFSSRDQRRDSGEPSIIAGITREIIANFPVEPQRVYIAGLSAGGAAAANMGSLYPDLYAAIGVHSGLACGAASDMPSAFTAMKQGAAATKSPRGEGTVPAIVFHGDRDATVHPINSDDVVGQAKGKANLQETVTSGVAAGGRKFTRTVHADETGLPVAEHWILHGAGHAWSGGDPSGSYTDPRGPDASREMMQFFARHRVK